MKDYSVSKVKDTGARYRKKEVKYLTVKSKGDSFSPRKIKKIVKKLIKKKKAITEDTLLQIVIDTPSYGWRAGRTFNINDNIEIWNGADYGYLNEFEDIDIFNIYIIPDTDKAGGEDNKLNDCLYKAVYRALDGKIENPKLQRPAYFKKMVMSKTVYDIYTKKNIYHRWTIWWL